MKTKNLFFYLIIFCLTTKLLNAQINDSAFLFLNKSLIFTEIFYDKAPHYSNIQFYDGANDSICTYANWQQIYGTLYGAAWEQQYSLKNYAPILKFLTFIAA